MKRSKNVQTILQILHDEARGDTNAALQKMSSDYTMTWMYQSTRKLFPTTKVTRRSQIGDTYAIKGRKYIIKNVGEGQDVVFVELIESYPDPKTGQVYRTPLVLVLEMKGGRVRTGRHYCDPRLSYMKLTPVQLRRAYRNPQATNRIVSATRRAV